jgi:hypothetical protein
MVTDLLNERYHKVVIKLHVSQRRGMIEIGLKGGSLGAPSNSFSRQPVVASFEIHLLLPWLPIHPI